MFFLSSLIFSSCYSCRCTCLSLPQSALFSLYRWPCPCVCWRERGQHAVDITPRPCRQQPHHVGDFNSRPSLSSDTHTLTAVTGCPRRPAITRDLVLCFPCQVTRHATQQLAHIQTHIHSTRLPDIDAKSMLFFFFSARVKSCFYILVGWIV